MSGATRPGPATERRCVIEQRQLGIMISEHGDIEVLLRAVTAGSFRDVIGRITIEKRAAEALAKASIEPLRSQMFDYTRSCRCLKFWLTTKNKPRNCEAFEKFRPLTEALVTRGSLPGSVMEAFGQPSGAAR